MLNSIKLAIIIFVCAFISACVNPAIKQNPAPANTSPASTAANTTVKLNPVKTSDAIAYLEFAESFSNMPADSQKQALISTNQALALNQNDLLHRMKLIMIYGLPSSTLLDTPKAQQLLQQLLQEDILANSQLAFAHLLFDHLVIVNKAVKQSNGDPKRLDGLQQKNEALQAKLESAQQKLEITQQKLDTAQQKLDELKKIEKSMGERDTGAKK